MRSATLTENEGRLLVEEARRAIAERLGLARGSAWRAEDGTLGRDGASFVTLSIGGALRGCIGTLQAREPLIDNVRANAVNAAFADSRFRPLSADEFARIAIEVSVLSAPTPLDYADGADLVARLRPGIDGVVISRGWARATFLPQVWDQLPAPEDFLGHLCRKAGLPEDAWRDGSLAVSTYQVRHFG